MTNSSQEDIALQVLEVKEKILEQAITAISRIHKDINNSIIDGDAKTLETNIITAFDSQYPFKTHTWLLCKQRLMTY